MVRRVDTPSVGAGRAACTVLPPVAACGDEARRNEADGTFHRICNGSCLALKRAIVAPRCGTGHTWDGFITACKPSSLARVRFFLRAASGIGSEYLYISTTTGAVRNCPMAVFVQEDRREGLGDAFIAFGLEYVFYGRELFFFFDACGSCHSMLYVRNESCLLTNWSLPTSWGETLPSWVNPWERVSEMMRPLVNKYAARNLSLSSNRNPNPNLPNPFLYMCVATHPVLIGKRIYDNLELWRADETEPSRKGPPDRRRLRAGWRHCGGLFIPASSRSEAWRNSCVGWQAVLASER